MGTKFTTIALIVIVCLTTISITIRPSLIDDTCDTCSQIALFAGDIIDVQFSNLKSEKEFYASFTGTSIRLRK